MDELLDEFEQRLLEAAAWADSKAPFHDLRTSLRSPELEPKVAPFPNLMRPVALEKAVTFVAQQRRLRLKDRPGGRSKGHTLICECNLSITSGESERATGGFFDVSDRPPWDTWVLSIDFAFSRDFDLILVSWVPDSLLEIVDQGIAVNPYDCIYWPRNAPPEIKRHPLIQRLLQE